MPRSGPGPLTGLPSKQNLSGVRRGQASQQRHQRRFARAGIADDGHELARAHVQVDIAQHLALPRARAERLGDVLELEQRHEAMRRQGHANFIRCSTTLISRSSTKPTTPMVRMQRMMCS